MNRTIAVVMLAALNLISGCGFNGSPGTGQKVGVIVKVGKTGLMAKTWEAEIVRGGFQAGSGVNGQSFHFTIENEILAKKVQEAMDNQKEVKISYRSECVYSAFRSDSGGDFLESIEPVSK